MKDVIAIGVDIAMNVIQVHGVDLCHETIRYRWGRFGPMFAPEVRNRRIRHRAFSQWAGGIVRLTVAVPAE